MATRGIHSTFSTQPIKCFTCFSYPDLQTNTKNMPKNKLSLALPKPSAQPGSISHYPASSVCTWLQASPNCATNMHPALHLGLPSHFHPAESISLSTSQAEAGQHVQSDQKQWEHFPSLYQHNSVFPSWVIHPPLPPPIIRKVKRNLMSPIKTNNSWLG